MKLFPPEPRVDLYKEGFGVNDLLNRKPTGQSLSNLVERIEDPLVIVLDGPWGSGKSYFLKRWVGAHAVENDGKATTVYFDAFANDFLDDPLTGLAGTISERLPADTKPQAKRALKGAVATLARPALRMCLAVATAGIAEAASAIVDAAVAAGSGEIEKAADNFWKREEGRREAMRQVEQSLKEITTGADGAPRKLAIVVDELDRCRPDYALAVLEIIKHFFAVPHVHFILGVNLRALEHSVCARYGSNFDAEGFLRRFVSVSLSLPDNFDHHRDISVTRAYVKHTGQAMGLPRQILEVIDRHLTLGGSIKAATIRDANKVLSLATILPRIEDFDRFRWGYQEAIVSLLMMKALSPSLHQRILAHAATLKEVRSFYGITDRQTTDMSDPNYSRPAYVIVGVWKLLLEGTKEEDDEMFAKGFDSFRVHNTKAVLDGIIQNYINQINIRLDGSE